MRVMIVVTHLLGTGHLARALTLGRAYLAAGHSVCVVSGGGQAPLLDSADVPLVQLPPLRSDGTDFSRLLDRDGILASPEYLVQRQKILLNNFAEFTPDILITELFPFGRRSLRSEFIALLETALRAEQPPIICASVRDILAPPSTPEKASKTEAILLKYYDAVLVHSDASVAPLDASWPVTPQIRDLLRYTGFVARPPAEPHPDKIGQGEIVVSAGGGRVGKPLFETALLLARRDPTRSWRLLIGGNDSSIISDFASRAPDNVVVEAARNDFRQILYHAAASVSLCGYNTALDILQTSVPAVFVPFDDANEVEQALRAKALERLDGIEVLSTAQLTPEKLQEKLLKAISGPRRAARRSGLDGAQRTVDISRNLLEKRA